MTIPPRSTAPLSCGVRPLPRRGWLLGLLVAWMMVASGVGLPGEEPRSRWTRPGADTPPPVNTEATSDSTRWSGPVYLIPTSEDRGLRDLLGRVVELGEEQFHFPVFRVGSVAELQAALAEEETLAERVRVVFVGEGEFWVQDVDEDGLGALQPPQDHQAILLDNSRGRHRAFIVIAHSIDYTYESSGPSPTGEFVLQDQTRAVDIADWLDWVAGEGQGTALRPELRIVVSENWRPVVDRALDRSGFAGRIVWLDAEGRTVDEGRAVRREAEAEALARWNAGLIFGRLADGSVTEELERRALMGSLEEIPEYGRR